MLIHASCAARDGNGVLIIGPPGSGKSDLLLRLLDRGFVLVADDQVDLTDDMAGPPATLEGLLEIRGLGIVRLPYVAPVRVILDVTLGSADRLPGARAAAPGRPAIVIDPTLASAAQRIDLALDCALGVVAQHTGVFSRW